MLWFHALRVGRRQAISEAMLSHFHGLIGADAQCRAWLAGTQQRESSLAILRKEAYGIGLVHLAGFFEPARASEAPPLMTKGRQPDSQA